MFGGSQQQAAEAPPTQVDVYPEYRSAITASKFFAMMR
jgi:hypothetical protein